MMNDHGKSDRPIVPGKSPNKAERSVADEMEGRGLAKGNLQEQNASRTQRRGDALSAFERVRQAARKDRKTQFTALLHHISPAEGTLAAFTFTERRYVRWRL
jgi:dihydroxyacetone kinase